VKSLKSYFFTWEEIVYYNNYKRKYTYLFIDGILIVRPAMVHEEKGKTRTNLYIYTFYKY
jgi:hypothetical protein